MQQKREKDTQNGLNQTSRLRILLLQTKGKKTKNEKHMGTSEHIAQALSPYYNMSI